MKNIKIWQKCGTFIDAHKYVFQKVLDHYFITFSSKLKKKYVIFCQKFKKITVKTCATHFHKHNISDYVSTKFISFYQLFPILLKFKILFLE